MRNRADWNESDLVVERADSDQDLVDNNQTYDETVIDYSDDKVRSVSENTDERVPDNSVSLGELVEHHFVGITPPTTVQRVGKLSVGTPDTVQDVEVQQLFDDVFNVSDAVDSNTEDVIRQSSTCPLPFNAESRTYVVTRMRKKYGAGEFYGGNTRVAMFDSKSRPPISDWEEFLDYCIANSLLYFRTCRNRRIFRFNQ